MVRDVRAVLKSATSHLHEKVDAAMPLSRPAPTLQDYSSHLRILGGWLRDLQALGVDPARLRAEAEAIDADLSECASLLAQPASAEVQTASLPSPSAEGAPDALAWGARYVLEGSRLGAKVLHRHLAPSLAPHPLAYLSGAGWVAEGAWRDFLEALRRHVATAPDIERACEGAQAAFRLLLQRCGSQRQVALP